MRKKRLKNIIFKIFPEQKEKSEGFTLVELLLVIFLILIISAAVFAQKGNMENGLILQKQARQLLQDLKETEESALGAEGFFCPTNSTTTYSVGLNFKKTNDSSYFIFADCDNSHKYDSDDKIIKQVELNKKIKLSFVDHPAANLNIVFSPPVPKVYIDGNEWSSSEAKVKLSLRNNPSKSITIAVNSAGRIKLED